MQSLADLASTLLPRLAPVGLLRLLLPHPRRPRLPRRPLAQGRHLALHVASWHFFDPDPERDEYLKLLIAACHRHGILVYAWVEMPHVSEKFWNDHPQWREKTAVLQDAQLDWRKLMNLQNRECAAAGARRPRPP